MAKLSNKSAVLMGMALIFILSTTVTATVTMKDQVCTWVNMILETILVIGPALLVIMFTYGGLKYVYSAGDPGGRKSGKLTCIHAIIGGILLTLASIVIQVLFPGSTGWCV
jgi:hypothetical protein